MRDDPLAQFRRMSSTSTVGVQPPKEVDEYVAFGTKDKVSRLRIRSRNAPVNAPGYNILLNIVYDGEKGTHFVLVYTVLMVLVQGRNLQKAIYAIENSMADYIQEFDPARWPAPGDPAAAVIDSIEVRTIQSGNTETEH